MFKLPRLFPLGLRAQRGGLVTASTWAWSPLRWRCGEGPDHRDHELFGPGRKERRHVGGTVGRLGGAGGRGAWVFLKTLARSPS